ncbi:Serine/threonine-protein kinase PknD [Rosistilla carotiformis]|uniref:Serine/threonine-protein kinase PknD n=1 Tax=Rosistilla carotiformis TaxID=2528017 RepID=A0A518JMS9_9BACT|nr:hypothetical protein [Rosistilla carotiformis]QDV66801.1 Serine/threonine-protein kinase PknD [Rosistilla carotiformis]
MFQSARFLFFGLTSFVLLSQASPLAIGAPIGGDLLDRGAFAQWVDGEESAISESDAKQGPGSLVWSEKHRPDWKGVKFGQGRAAGPRHLRIGMTEPTAIGSVLVRGGGTLSVLKPGVPYPGNLADDSQWMIAERLIDGRPSQEPVDREGYAIWLLPAGTQTQAVRFSHTPAAGDPEMAGWIGGVWIDRQRFGNVAPQAVVQSVAREDVGARLVDRSNNRMWKTWDNGEQGAAQPISLSNPETVTLTWSKPVTLDGLCLLWTGFAALEVDAFGGSAGSQPLDAAETDWQKVGGRSEMDPLYPMGLGPNWVPFDKTVTTRAIRLRIVAGAKANHSHLESKVKDGRRVWLGELMAIAPLADDAHLASLVLPQASEVPPPIPVRFHLPEAGLVTLVIEDQNGQRVRNLVSETPYPAGENVAWWDGSDDLTRDPEAARHGVYYIPTRFVEPGTYTVRGLWRKPLQLRYEFSIYNAGKPAWRTADNTGCWLTTHTPPSSMAVVPGLRTADGEPLVFMGAYVAEGGHGLQWLREDGTKLGGQHWVGGHWTGAPTLAVDNGDGAVADHLCYVGSIWEGELRLTAKTRKLQDAEVFKLVLGKDPKNRSNAPLPYPELEGFDGGEKQFVLGGLAAHNGSLVCSLVRQNELLIVDSAEGKITSRIALDDPRGLAFDDRGRLLVLSGKKLVRLETLASEPQTIIGDGLEDPRHVAFATDGRMFISDRGQSHQVKIFSPEGKLMGTIGRPGAPAAGRYDPLHMNDPNGLAIDTQGRLWVAESSNHPRRVSLWSADGSLQRAFYGPTEYGGGGALDPRDPTRFYYKGMEFKLDWEAGTDSLTRVFHLPSPLLDAHYGPYSPDTPLNPPLSSGRRYFTSCYTHTPTNGDNVAFLWLDEEPLTRLVAAVGDARSWSVLREPEFHDRWPAGSKPAEDRPRDATPVAFAWTDANGDGRPQPEELQFVAESCSGVCVMNDLSVVVARYGDRNVRIAAKIDAAGLPRFDMHQPEALGPAAGRPQSSGGNQSLTEPGGWTIQTNAPEPFSPYGLGGGLNGKPRWSYPSPWPGLHASHEAAVPDRPGMVIGHTRLLGGWIQGNAGPMFCVNGNMGNMYLFTADGLFVSTLFHDIRTRPNWAAPVAQRNMDVTDVSLHDENFWPSITQTTDGKVFLVDGGRTSLVRVDGLETLQRLPELNLQVSSDDLQEARQWFANVESQRQQQRGRGTVEVPLRRTPLQVDGQLDDWPAETDWAFIDRRGIKANFNSDSRPYEVSAAVTVTDSHLFAAWRTTEKNLLANSGETPNALFKTGGCLDLMLATDAGAAADRRSPVPGDQRLLITQVDGQTRALLYRARVPGTKQPVGFSSPWRTIELDVVEDVSRDVTLAADGQGNFEISIPLKRLNWQPVAGQTYQADLGVLRGAGGQTTQRVYWSNKATAITADVPSEAELTPSLWGRWKVVASEE